MSSRQHAVAVTCKVGLSCTPVASLVREPNADRRREERGIHSSYLSLQPKKDTRTANTLA